MGIMAVLLCFGLLSPVLPGQSTHTASAASIPPPPLRVISRGVPAYASSTRGGPPNAANDNDYATFWRSSGAPAWLAYDLSAVPGPLRGNILLAWYNDPTTPDYDYTLGKSTPYDLPSAYTIEGNAAGSGAPPQDGWKALATVTDNKFHSRQHALDSAATTGLGSTLVPWPGNP